MAQARQLGADAILSRKVKLSDGYALSIGTVGKDCSPRINDQRMTIGRPTRAVSSLLGSSEHEALVLDRPRTQEHVPVVLAGVQREGRWYAQHSGASRYQATIELRKAEVVTDG